ncbi:SLBB domain-containing protein [Candidatus Eisenbacteria bacterium]|uniref:SLBB domain-containing protein n=1 Tax=Eiseniibacteriota bacterium TaxID=2212470 RepID=A0ABV6YKC7_UNCEI
MAQARFFSFIGLSTLGVLCGAILTAWLPSTTHALGSRSSSALDPDIVRGQTSKTKNQERYTPRSTRLDDLVLEEAVDPANYRLAPGDRLVLSVWGAADIDFDLEVAADGTLLVPTIGVFAANGLSLDAATDLIREGCVDRYPNSDVSLTLVRPAWIRIPITGGVLSPDTYTVLSTSRLSELAFLAGGLSEGADSRAILIQSNDGTERRCDLLSWQTDGVPEGNPSLRFGDRVHVAPARSVYRVRGVFPQDDDATVGGASLLDRPFQPRTHLVPTRPGDNLSFVLRAAGGRTAGNCRDGVWVRRGEQGGKGDGTFWVDLDEAGSFLMEEKDDIEVPFCREWIAVGGSVSRPGLYPFLPGETVAGYVYAAGGPNEIGRTGGWKISGPHEATLRAVAPGDTVLAGSQIWVPERKSHTVSRLITPIGTAVAIIVSIIALTR